MNVITQQDNAVVTSPFASIGYICGSLTNLAHALYTTTAVLDNSVTLMGEITQYALEAQRDKLLAELSTRPALT